MNSTLAIVGEASSTAALPHGVSPENPTQDAQVIWSVIFPLLPWPVGQSVRWARFGRPVDYYKKLPLKPFAKTSSGKYRKMPFGTRCVLGFYRPFRRQVFLNLNYLQPASQEAVDVLIHELTHAAGYDRHNLAFYRVQNEARARLRLPPVWRLDRFGDPLPLREKKQRRCEATLPLWQEARP